jgi:hypothetical protein
MPYVNHFADIAALVKPRAAELADTTAGTAAEHAAAHSRVDTSSLQVGWYRLSKKYDGYDAAVAAAKDVNPPVVIVDKADDVGDTAAAVANVTGHADINEHGGAHYSAQPMLAPAFDEVRPAFNEGLSHLLDLP